MAPVGNDRFHGRGGFHDKDGFHGKVVVGIDTLEDSLAALDWAAQTASQRGADLEIVHGVQFTPAVDPWTAGYAPEILEQLDEAVWNQLAQARQVAVRQVHGDVRATLVHDHPRPALLAAARHADLLVTGARRRNRLRAGLFGGFQLGSTSLFAASHAPCPVVVVRGPAVEGARDVVVGFDGSPAATAAARWAVGHAAGTGARVRVLLVWHSVAHVAIGLDPIAVQQTRDADETAAHARLEDLLGWLREEEPRVDVTGAVIEDLHPEDVLLEAAGTCALLVVGSRGHVALTSALIGSTSHAVLHHASTPVVVVPDAEQIAHRRRQAEHSLARH